MELDTIPSLDAAQTEADQADLPLSEQSDFLNFHADRIKAAAQRDFASPDQYKNEQDFIKFTNESLASKQKAISQKKTQEVLDSHFGDDNTAKQAFVNDYARNNGDTSEWSPNMKSIENDIHAATSDIAVPLQKTVVNGALRDSHQNPLVTFKVDADNQGHPLTAALEFQGQKYESDNPQADAADVTGLVAPIRKAVATISGKPLTPYVKGGDTVIFPKNFDPIQYQIDASAQSHRSVTESDSTTTPSNTMLEIKSRENERRLKALTPGTNAYALAWSDGVNQYVKDQILSRKEADHPRYGDVGEGIASSIGDDIANFLPRFSLGLAGMATATAEAINRGGEAARNQIDSLTGVRLLPKGFGEQAINSVAGDIGAAYKALNNRENYSELDVTDPGLADIARGVSQTMQSLTQSAVGAAASPVFGLVGMASVAGGQQYSQLVGLEESLRAEGRDAEADNIHNQRVLSAGVTAATEYGSEVIFPEHNIFRGGPRQRLLKELATGTWHEGAEEIISGIPQALSSYWQGITNDKQFAEDIANLPSQAIYGGLGGFVAGGFHHALGGMDRIRTQIETEQRRAEIDSITNEVNALKATNPRLSTKQAFEDVLQSRKEKADKEASDAIESAAPELGDTSLLAGKYIAHEPTVSEVNKDIADISGDISSQLDQEKKVTQAQAELLTPVSQLESANKPSPLTEAVSAPVTEKPDVVSVPAESVTQKPVVSVTEPQAPVTLHPAVVPQAESTEKPVAAPTEAPAQSPQYADSLARARKLMHAIFISNIGWLSDLERQHGPAAADAAALYISARPESVMLGDGGIFHYVVDQIPTATENNNAHVREQVFADLHNNDIRMTVRYQNADEAGKKKIEEEEFMRAQSVALYRGLPEVAYASKYGKFSIDTLEGIRAKVESGEIDPSEHLFYGHVESGAASNELEELVGSDRVIGSEVGTVGTMDNPLEPGYVIQNKHIEQKFLEGSPFHIPSHSVTDLMPDAQAQSEIRLGLNQHGSGEVALRALTDEARNKLFSQLDALYPQGWVAKKATGLQALGMIKSGDQEKRNKAVISIDPGNDFIFQPFQDIHTEYRMSVYVNQDGKAVPVAGGFQTRSLQRGGHTWEHYGRSLLTAEQNKDARQILDFLNQKGFGGETNTYYGLDVFKLKDGSLRITELNPTDSYGASGGIGMFEGAQRGLEGLARGKHSLEAIAARAAMLFRQGYRDLAFAMLDDAVKQGGGVIADAEQLREKGKMFYGPDSIIPDPRGTQLLRSFPIPSIQNFDSAVGHITYTVEDLLNDFVKAGGPTGAAVKVILDEAKKADNPGLRSVVAKSVNRGTSYYLRERLSSIGKIVLTPSGLNTATAMHEVGHALSWNAIPSELSVYAYNKINGKQYFTRLQSYLKNGSNPVLKQVILDYITTVEGLGFSGEVFGNQVIRSGNRSKTSLYALSSLDEFVAEMYSGDKLKSLLNSIQHDVVKTSLVKRFASKVVDFIKTHLFGSPNRHATFFDHVFQNVLLLSNYNEPTQNEWDRQQFSAQRYSNNYELTNLRKEADTLSAKENPTKRDLNYLSQLNKRIAELAPSQSAMYVVTPRGYVLDKTHPNFKQWRTSKKLNRDDAMPYIASTKKTQKGYESETSNNIIPISDSYEIDRQGTWFNGSNVEVPPGAGHDQIIQAIKDKYKAAGKDYNATDEDPADRGQRSATFKRNAPNNEGSVTERVYHGTISSTPFKFRKRMSGIWTAFDKGNALPGTGESVGGVFTLNADPGAHPVTLNESDAKEFSASKNPLKWMRDFHGFGFAQRGYGNVNPTSVRIGDYALVVFDPKQLSQVSFDPPYVNAPRYAPPQPTVVQVDGRNIDKRYLNRAQRQELRETLANTKLPSSEREKILKRLDGRAQRAEYRILKKLYREPFVGYTFTTIRDAKVKLVDWLIDNPTEKGGIPASLRAKNRVQQARTMRYLKEKTDAGVRGDYEGFSTLAPNIQAIVKGVLAHINDTAFAAQMTNRQMMAINMGLKIFHESDGVDVRGLAALAEKIATGIKIKILADVKKELADRGIFRIFGDAINDWRRGAFGGSKTLTGFADKSTEWDAIFNRTETAHAWVKFMSPSLVGINNFKFNNLQLQKQYGARIEKIGKTTRYEDARISIAKLTTQFEINPLKDPVGQLKQAIGAMHTSISRKESSTISRHQGEGQIERAAFNNLIGPVQAGIADGTLVDENDIIDAIEAGLTERESQLLNIIREPGYQYWTQLNSIHQITRGESIDQIQNFVHRSQYSLNSESDVNHWSRRQTEASDPIMKPRQGLGGDSADVFNMDWRGDFAEHLKQAMYEMHTGVERVFTHRAIKDRAFGNILDDLASNRIRSKRILAQYGGIFANLKNKELQYDAWMKTFVNGAQFVNWWKLVSGKGALNQSIPMFAMMMKYPQAMVVAGVNRLPIVGHNGRSVTDNFLRKYNPDLFKRLSHFDQTIEPIRGKGRINKQSGLPGVSSAQQAVEKTIELASAFGSFSARVAGFGVRLPVVITNGLTESFSAKAAFLGIYSQKLLDKGLISNLEDIYSRHVYDEESLAAAELEIDNFVLAPLSPEMRGDFWQKNSAGKEFWRSTLFALSRTSIQQTIKAGTAWRDLALSIKDYAQYGKPEDLAQMRRSFQNAAVQGMQLAAYQMMNLAHLGLSLSVAKTGLFLAQAIMNGDEPDREKWMRRMRILEKINISNAGRFMASQGAVDVALQFVPMSPALTSNVGRGFAADIFKHIFDLSGDIPTMQNELDGMHEEIGKYDTYMKHASLLKSPSMYAKATEAREALEYAAEIQKRKIAAKKNWVASTGADLSKNMMPFGNYVDTHSRQFPEMEAEAAQLLKGKAPDWLYQFLMGDDNAKALKQDGIAEGRDNAFYWWMSYWFNLAPPVRSAASSVLTEKTTEEVDKILSQQKRDKKNIEMMQAH